jgi:hypothetical protein
MILVWMLRETGWKVVDRIHLHSGQRPVAALVNTVMNLGIPYEAENFLLTS